MSLRNRFAHHRLPMAIALALVLGACSSPATTTTEATPATNGTPAAPSSRTTATPGTTPGTTTATTATTGDTGTAAPVLDAPAGARLYGVGQRTMTFVDETRPTPEKSDGSVKAATSRTLPTVVLYPSTGPAADPTPVVDAPVAEGRFPVLELSHGNTSWAEAYIPLLEHWAQAGYVVAMPTFPITSHGGTNAQNVADYVHQPGDVQFVLTQVLALDTKADDPLRGHLDADEVAIGGHSLGAMTSIGFFNSCCADPRVKAAIAISGSALPFPGGTFDAPPTVPLLLIHGQKDETVPYAGSQHVFDTFPGPRAFLTPPSGTHVGILAQVSTSAVAIAFLDLELRHDPARWHALPAELRNDTTAPGDTLAVAGGVPQP